jgi:antitoxin component of MazEF toxin-antitoxin module
MSEVFEAKVRRVGNSLGIIIPREVIDEGGYRPGDRINVAIPPAGMKERNLRLRKAAGRFPQLEPFERDKGGRS